MSKDCWSRIHFEGKLGYKISTNRAVLAQLLLKRFRIPFEMPQYSVVCRHEQRRNIHKELPKLDAVAALMRRAEEDDSVCRHLDGPVFRQRALTGGIGMDESLY